LFISDYATKHVVHTITKYNMQREDNVKANTANKMYHK
jgi:hypothetical protein